MDQSAYKEASYAEALDAISEEIKNWQKGRLKTQIAMHNVAFIMDRSGALMEYSLGPKT